MNLLIFALLLVTNSEAQSPGTRNPLPALQKPNQAGQVSRAPMPAEAAVRPQVPAISTQPSTPVSNRPRMPEVPALQALSPTPVPPPPPAVIVHLASTLPPAPEPASTSAPLPVRDTVPPRIIVQSPTPSLVLPPPATVPPAPQPSSPLNELSHIIDFGVESSSTPSQQPDAVKEEKPSSSAVSSLLAVTNPPRTITTSSSVSALPTMLFGLPSSAKSNEDVNIQLPLFPIITPANPQKPAIAASTVAVDIEFPEATPISVNPLNFDAEKSTVQTNTTDNGFSSTGFGNGSHQKQGESLSTGTIAGLIVGCLIALTVTVGAIAYSKSNPEASVRKSSLQRMKLYDYLKTNPHLFMSRFSTSAANKDVEVDGYSLRSLSRSSDSEW